MFDSCVEIKRTKMTLRKKLSLPVAILVHASLFGLVWAYSLFGFVPLRPPSGRIGAGPCSIPLPPAQKVEQVALVEKTPAPPPETPKPRDGLVEPSEILDRIPAPAFRPPGADHLLHFIEGMPPLGGEPGRGPGLIGRGDPRPPEDPKWVGQDIRAPRVLKRVEPRYPEHARMLRKTGRVTLVLTIDAAGTVIDAKVARSTDSIFDAAALEAAWKWNFSPPTTYKGERVKVFHYVTFNFKLR